MAADTAAVVAAVDYFFACPVEVVESFEDLASDEEMMMQHRYHHSDDPP